MRVLVISHAYPFAAQQAQLLACLAEDGLDLGLMAPKTYPWSLNGEKIITKVQDTRLVTFPVQAFFTSRQGAFVYSPLEMKRAIDRFRPDLLYLEQEVYALSALQISFHAHMHRIPLCIFVWENVCRRLMPLRRKIRDYVLRRSQGLVAGSPSAMAVHKGWGYIGLMEVIPQFGVVIDPAPAFHESRPPRPFTIAYFGRLVHEKAIEVLLDASAQLMHQNIDCRTLIVGSGPMESRLRKVACDLGIEKIVTWEPAVAFHRVPKLMKQADVLVLPSRRIAGWTEQFGRVLIEAMSLGVPVVGSSSGAIPAVIDNPELIFEEDNSQHLQHILKRLAMSDNFRLSCARSAYYRVQRQYSQQGVARQHVEFWRRMLLLQPTSSAGIADQKVKT